MARKIVTIDEETKALPAVAREAIDARIGAVGDPKYLSKAAADATYVPADSPVDPDSPYWEVYGNVYGMNPETSHIPSIQQGGIEIQDGMLTVQSGGGRWGKDNPYGGTHTYGSHVFEAWTRNRAWRMTMLLGMNGDQEGALFMFNPSSVTFGRLRLGSDNLTKGIAFVNGATELEFNTKNIVKQPEFLRTDVNNSYIEATASNGFGSSATTGRAGGSFKMYGESHATSPGQVEFYCGSYRTDIPAAALELFRQTPSGRTSLFKVSQYRTTVAGRVQVGSAPPGTPTSNGLAGDITWDATHLYICTAANSWKRVALEDWIV